MRYAIIAVLMMMAMGYSHAAFDRTQCEERTFIVTAYYSPENDQAFYYKPDVKQEKILNGEGHIGASGKKVFNGIVAAPSGYPFGGRVYFPGLGVGEITDRGGAIVHSGERGFEYDRIDIWMGRGEEGLVRALIFGKQTLKGYYCKKDTAGISKVKKGFYRDSIPVYENFFDIALWIQELKPGRSDVWAYTLQKYLIKLGYLKLDTPTGNFGTNTKKALCNYQVKRGIYKKDSAGCGNFDRRTRVVMKNDVTKKGLFPDNLWKKGNIDNIVSYAQGVQGTIIPSEDAKNQDTTSASIGKKLLNAYFTDSYSKNDTHEKIKTLQLLLQNLGLYKGKIDGTYTYDTIAAVYSFQKKFGLVNDSTPSAARGHMGPATRDLLNQKLAENDVRAKDISPQQTKPQETVSIKNNKPTVVSVKPTSKPTITTSIPDSFSFYRPYDLKEKNKEVRYLQDFLRAYGVYKGEIHGVYNDETVDALFAFQQKEKLISNDAPITLRGFLGPKTRDRINALIGG